MTQTSQNEFQCTIDGEVYRGMPSFAAPQPESYFMIPEAQRAARCVVSDDACVIDERQFFIRACLDIPVHGYTLPLTYSVWTAISEESFVDWTDKYQLAKRKNTAAYFGWLNTILAGYPDTYNLKVQVQLRDDGAAPIALLEQTNHPLSVEQRDGIHATRVAQLFEIMMKGL